MKLFIKLFTFLSFVFILVALTGCSLFKSMSAEQAKANLENAGYEVVVMTGEEFIKSDKNKSPAIETNELEKYVYGKKGEDVIHLYFFKSIDVASKYMEVIQATNLKQGQKNELLYFGTQQAIKDAGI